MVTQEEQLAAVEEAVAAEREAEQEAAEEYIESHVNNNAQSSRLAKLQQLRRRMNESTTANRKDVANEANKRKLSAQEAARLERKRKQAEVFQEKLDAEETGKDLERKRAWEYSIEDNEAWDKKQAKKASRAQFEFTDYDDIARRKYRRDMDTFKPDLKSYRAQRNAALGLPDASSSTQVTESASQDVARASEMLYRDANSFVYADHKPSEESIDKVIHKINMDVDKRNKFSRKRKEVDGDVTYINERNRQFNKKLDRYFNKYTQEIRDNFERGTAL